MRQAALLVALGLVAVAVVTPHAATPAFPYGVAAGDVTTSSAILWARAPGGTGPG